MRSRYEGSSIPGRAVLGRAVMGSRGRFDAVVSALARVEVPSAIWKKQRTGELDPGQALLLTSRFERHFSGVDPTVRFVVVAAGWPVLEDAAELVATRGLRAYDAVQLASALAARVADPQVTEFACFDGQLRAAAAATGLSLIPR